LVHQLCDLRIFVEETSESVVPDDRGIRVNRCAREGPERCGLAQTAVRAMGVEVILILVQYSAGVRGVEDEEPVQTAPVGRCPRSAHRWRSLGVPGRGS
jgi:hypothetical protein